MYQMNYQQYIEEHPNTPFSNFLVRFFSAKPDFTQLDKEVEETKHFILSEQKKDFERMMAEKEKNDVSAY